MDSVLTRKPAGTSTVPTVTAIVAPQQQQRARRKAPMSARALVSAAAVRGDPMFISPGDSGDKVTGTKNSDGTPPPATSTSATVSVDLKQPSHNLSHGDNSTTSNRPADALLVPRHLSGPSTSSAVVAGRYTFSGEGGSGSDSSGSSIGNNNNNGNCRTSSKKKTALSAHAVEYLKNWMMSPEHVDHPYPTEEEKLRIMNETGIVLKQLTNWFVNNRKRYWKPKVEELKRRQGSGGGGGGGKEEMTTTMEVVTDWVGADVVAPSSTMTVMAPTKANGKDEGGGVGGQQKEDNNSRRPHSPRRVVLKRSIDDDGDASTTHSFTTKKIRGSTGNDSLMKNTTTTPTTISKLLLPPTYEGVAITMTGHESVMASYMMKITRAGANFSSLLNVVSDESAEEGRGGDGLGGRSCGTEEDSGDDIDVIRNAYISNPLLVDMAAASTQTTHPQVMNMIDIDYSFSPLDIDDTNEDQQQQHICSTVLPHSCIDPKNHFAQPCALCAACRDWNLGEFCPWDLTGILGDVSTDNVTLAETLTYPATQTLLSMSSSSPGIAGSGDGASSTEDGSSAHCETSSIEEMGGTTTVVTKSSSVGDIGPTVMSMYSNISVPQEISHSISAMNFMADFESWD